MALATRRHRRSSIDIWPGFVDALAQLLMVIIFILLVFTAGQFYLSDALSGRDQALKKLQQQVSELTNLLAGEQQANQQLRVNALALTSQLNDLRTERNTLTTHLQEMAAKAKEAEARADAATGKLQEATALVTTDKATVEMQLKELASLKEDIAALQQVRNQLETRVAWLAGAQRLTEQQAGALRDRTKQLEAKLADTRERTVLAQQAIKKPAVDVAELAQRADTAEKALTAERAATAAAHAQVETLTYEVAGLRLELARIAAALDASEATVKNQQEQIVNLGKRLNMALVNKVEELAKYRSEFFGRMRQIIGHRKDIRIVGDRFVFQSEVLFAPGSADLTDAAKTQLAPVLTALKQIATKIPSDIDWVLLVDGNTDSRKIDTPQFPSNWELSTARAISVVRYAVQEGIPRDHLAAAGYADTYPIDPANTPAAYAKNRRIELKLTER
ncbi:MAG TPA: peptidoglycan -binding protein [Stellaceae bacterium]|nr:peptidoglycan -binding protein [Stellaceae bacterium]